MEKTEGRFTAMEMYDLSSEFNQFYDNEVVLPGEVQTDLFQKAKTNIRRLRKGLDEYNAEHSTAYKIAETVTQGSMAMHTTVQNDKNDYDIDIAIIFDKSNIGDDMGHIEIKHIVVDALSRKTKQFNTQPEAKKNCVRIVYSDGYHIDFAIYRKSKDVFGKDYFEHAGSQGWKRRDPKAINQWFQEEIADKGQNLRKAIRLSKMFCKSRPGWVMPGGLIQTVLCDEVLVNCNRLDECFYKTMDAVSNRLSYYKEVYNPTDPAISLLLKEKDRTEVENYGNRLRTYLDKLSPLFESGCTKSKAMDAWHDFFNHDFWKSDNDITKALVESRSFSSLPSFNDTEQFIEDKMSVVDKYDANITCQVTGNGYQSHDISYYYNLRYLPHNLKLYFTMNHNVPGNVEYYWKIKNVGKEAIKRNCVRGQVVKGSKTHVESTNFAGPHYVECYVVKDGICVARDRIYVPIG